MADEVEIERLGAQGDGVAEEGRLFVPFALSGERVRVVRRGAPGQVQRAAVQEVLVRSPERVTAPCAHFGTCGGCALQHASDPFLAVWKRDMVAAALASRGIEAPVIRPTVTSPPASRRRITVSARRTRKGTLVGFHAMGSAEIVGVRECHVAEPALVEALGRLDEVIGLAASRSGEVRITLTLTEGGVDVAVEQAKPITGPAQALLAGVAARAELARLSWNGEEVAVMRPPIVPMGRARVVPPPGGFLQPTVAGEAALVAAVREAVGEEGQAAAKVVDLFAGSGTFALPLAEDAEVHAVEGDGRALAALDSAWRTAPGLKRVTTERRDLARRALLARELGGFGAAVIDPPRAGARLQSEQLAGSEVGRIAAVSCNPATFARDARVLIDGGYRLEWVQPVDQFRWSPHVELVAAFRR